MLNLPRRADTASPLPPEVGQAQGAPFPLENLRALFEGAPIGVAVTREGRVLYANPAILALVGARQESEVLGQSVFDFLAPDERATLVERGAARTANGFGSQPTRYEARARRFDGTLMPMCVEVAPLALLDGPAIISYVFDLSPEQRDRKAIEDLLDKERRAASFARQLQGLSSAFSLASSPDDVAATSLESCMNASGAFAAVFVVPALSGGESLHLLQSRGFLAEAVAGWQNMNTSDQTPIAFSYRTGEAVWMSDTGAPSSIEKFPFIRGSKERTGTHALVTLPLLLDDRVVGVLGLGFDAPREYDDEERTFWLTLAAQCAQALARTRLDSQSRELARRQRESLALLNTLLDSAPVGFGLFDRDHHFVLVNEELARISARPLEDHVGQGAQDIFPALAGRLDPLLERVWNTGQPSEAQSFSLEAREGEAPALTESEMRHCSLSLYPVRVNSEGSGGEVLGVGAIFIETTERERSDRDRARLFAQLELERARFEAILQQMPSAVIIGEAPSGRLILGNPQVEAMMGRSFSTPASIEGYGAFRGFRPDGHELAPEEWPLSRALSHGEVVRGEEIVVPRDDGTLGVIRANAAPIRDREDRIIAGVLVFDNVTERARADAAQRFLAEAGAVLVAELDERQTFESLARLCVPRFADWCVIALAEPDGSLHGASIAHADAGQSQLAGQLQELLKRDPHLPWNLAGVVGAGRAALYSPATFESLRGRDRNSPYSRLSRLMGIHSAIVAPLAARGRVLGAMFWLSGDSNRPFDKTDIALAEEVARRAALSADNARLLQDAQIARDSAQKARDEAQAANRAKDEFLAVVSHELRTPLTPILGWLELLRSPGATEELRQQAYNVIERNANAQAQLVNDILDVSRITTGKLRLELRDVVLDELIARAVESLRTALSDKNLRVRLDLQADLHARADANRLSQVVWNLLQNAIKFTPSGGEIAVSLRALPNSSRETPRARLEVRDSGMGIEAELLPRVFERFQQGDSSSTRKAGGLGLGLAIVKHIAELHGGHADVSSAGRGKGATFGVELPLSPQPENAVPTDLPLAPDERLTSEKLKNARLLVVDDEPDTREMLARLLEDAGATVRVAPGGCAALDIVPQFAPDALVSDIGMPEMDGLELRRELLARGQTMPAIALTAYASSSDQTLALEAGFDAYLAKPVGALELVEAIARVLEQSKPQR